MEAQVKKKRKRDKPSNPGPAHAKQTTPGQHPIAAQPAAKKSGKPIQDNKQGPAKESSAADELDALFSSAIAAKRKKKDEPAPAAAAKAQEVSGSKDDIFGSGGGASRKRTKEGWKIYSEDELRINRGGDTERCPFDCDCCF